LVKAKHSRNPKHPPASISNYSFNSKQATPFSNGPDYLVEINFWLRVSEVMTSVWHKLCEPDSWRFLEVQENKANTGFEAED